MFHVELRQFPNVARAFNLNQEQLERQILEPWVNVGSVELQDRRWSAGRARLKIYEGPQLGPEQIGLGRGWANVSRAGRDVTEQRLTEFNQAAAHDPRLMRLKAALLENCRERQLDLPAIVALAGELDAALDERQRLALSERAASELLREGLLALTAAGPWTRRTTD
jgi:hypothetical protein